MLGNFKSVLPLAPIRLRGFRSNSRVPGVAPVGSEAGLGAATPALVPLEPATIPYHDAGDEARVS